MTYIIGCVSQKGGVAKSTTARFCARDFANAGWRVLIADMDRKQGTSTEWARRRNENKVTPEVQAMPIKSVSTVPFDSYDMVIFDGAPHSSADTKEIADKADLLLLPTGVSLDDLRPSVLLARELEAARIPKSKMVFVLCRTGSEAETAAARDYINLAGYICLDGEIPERAGYRDAQNSGRAISETRHASLNEKVDQVAQAIANIVNQFVEA